MSGKPLIAVTGATGLQGGSVAAYLLKDGGFRVRAITRNTESEKARALAASGAEVVRGDFDDPASLRTALKGVYGVFGVTNFWEPSVGQRETEQGKTLVDAAKEEGVKHFVWSTLEHSKPNDLGIGSPVLVHAESKALVDDYLKESGIPRTSLYTMFYFENFATFPQFQMQKKEGRVVAHWPFAWTDGPVGGYSVAETGAYVLEAFKKPQEWIGKDMKIISEVFTFRQFAKLAQEASGTEIDLIETSEEEFEKLRTTPGLEELWTNMKFFYICNGNPDHDFALTQRINPSNISFKDFIKANVEIFIPK